MADVPATFVSAGHGPGVGNDPEAERAEPLGLFWYTGAGTEGAILQDDLQTVASGLPSAIPAGTPIYLWQGSVAATLAARVIAHNWLSTRYVLALSPGGTALFAIPQETYGTASGATDLAGWVYRHATGWRRWQPGISSKRIIVLQNSTADKAITLWLGPGINHLVLHSSTGDKAITLWLGPGINHLVLHSGTADKAITLWHTTTTVLHSSTADKAVTLWS